MTDIQTDVLTDVLTDVMTDVMTDVLTDVKTNRDRMSTNINNASRTKSFGSAIDQ